MIAEVSARAFWGVTDGVASEFSIRPLLSLACRVSGS